MRGGRKVRKKGRGKCEKDNEKGLKKVEGKGKER
jgi:hypothetical protein